MQIGLKLDCKLNLFDEAQCRTLFEVRRIQFCGMHFVEPVSNSLSVDLTNVSVKVQEVHADALKKGKFQVWFG